MSGKNGIAPVNVCQPLSGILFNHWNSGKENRDRTVVVSICDFYDVTAFLVVGLIFSRGFTDGGGHWVF